MPDFLNGLFFSEILADNAGGSAVNVNGQGGANKQDEYIEIQNNTGSTVDLSGYQLWSDQNGLLHTFGAGDSVAAGGTATVVGTYNNPPTGFFGANGNNNSAGSNGGFLEDGEGNKFDTIYLVAPNGDYIQLSYGNPPRDPGGLPAGFPTGGTLQGDGEEIDSNAPNATSILRGAEGELVEGTPTPGTPGLVCFAEGTHVATENGPVAVEHLEPGTRIVTRDHGLQSLRAIRSAPIAKQVLRWNPEARPVRVPTGALSNTRALSLSPAHRVLVEGAMVNLLFGEAEVLVSARSLVGWNGIDIDHSDCSVSYYHLLFDQHEVVMAEDCWSESLFLGDRAQAAIEASSDWQVEPGVDLSTMAHTSTARRVLKSYEARLLASQLWPRGDAPVTAAYVGQKTGATGPSPNAV